MKKNLLLSSLALVTTAHMVSAASVAITLDQQPKGVIGSSTINLSAAGTLDWGIWQGFGNLAAPTESMLGGSGFTNISIFSPGTINENKAYNNPERLYTWSDGTISPTDTTVALTAAHTRVQPLAATTGQVLNLTLTVASAGSYQAKFYASTSEQLELTGNASLTTGSVTSQANGIIGPTNVQTVLYTVDFTTDSADTLSIDLSKISGAPGTVLALEAFSLTTIPEPSTAALLGLGALTLAFRRKKQT